MHKNNFQLKYKLSWKINKTIYFDFFVNGVWYRVEKIVDMPIGQRGPVKVQLIKLINYKPVTGVVDTVTGDYPWGDVPVDTNFGNAGGTFSGSGAPPPAETYYYTLVDCDGILAPIVGRSNVPVDIGKVCHLSGVAYVGSCWTVADLGVGPGVTTILQTFDDCAECAL